MTMNKDTGGSAFPVLQQYDRNGDVCIYAEDGMTLRDYFAAQALTAYIAENEARPIQQQAGADALASYAYYSADAMIKARQS